MFPADLHEQLKTRLESQQLPGYAAQRAFAPTLSYGRHAGPPSHDARRAAVVILLYVSDEQWQIPLTLRPVELVDHAGQICLPGGRLDAGETVEQAAARELEEEIGVPSNAIELLGRLTPLYLYNSNFHVTPCVAAAQGEPQFCVNQREVSELIRLPAHVLLDSASRQTVPLSRGGWQMAVPIWCWQSYCIWGATAMILGELSAVLRDMFDRPLPGD